MTQINLSESKQETASFPGFRDNGQATFVHIHDRREILSPMPDPTGLVVKNGMKMRS